MTLKSATYIISLCLLLFIQSTYTFSLKTLLFGDSNEDGGDSSASTPFGTPVADYPRSFRSDLPCSKYLCKETQDCVGAPIDCPCRLITDKKCIVGNWYACVRGDQSCDELL